MTANKSSRNLDKNSCKDTGLKMEERAVLANIASIITKDLLIDQPPAVAAPISFPLLDACDDDDEAEIFALMQKKRAAASAAGRKRRQPNEPEARKPEPKQAKLKWHHAELNLLHRYTDAQFESNLHMRKLTFLVCILVPFYICWDLR